MSTPVIAVRASTVVLVALLSSVGLRAEPIRVRHAEGLVHGFLTLRHAGDAVFGETMEPSMARPLEFLAAQFAMFGPVVFGVAIAATVRLSSVHLWPADRMLGACCAGYP